MGNTNLGTKNIFCYKVLPLTYDASLSYYEVLCKVTNAINEIQEILEGYDETLADLQTRISKVEEWISDYEDELIALEGRINANIAALETKIEAELLSIIGDVNDLKNYVDAQINITNARTDRAIALNNEYIFDYIDNNLSSILKVYNWFTGQIVTVQDMFNYLAQLHTTDALSYTQINGKNKTYAQLTALNLTYTDIIMRSAILIV